MRKPCRRPGPWAALMLLLCVVLPQDNAIAADPPATGKAPPPVSMDTLRDRIKQVTDSTALDEATRNRLVERYRDALSFLEAAASSQANSNAYREARNTAPVEAKRLRDRLEALQLSDAGIELKVTEASPLDAINQELITEKANLAAVGAKLEQVENELRTQIDRPAQARNRISEIKQRIEQIAVDRQQPPAEAESPRLAEARGWLLDTEDYALDAEILMLDRELLSQQVRVELLQAQRDSNASSLGRIQERVSRLEGMLSGRRLAEAAQAQSEAMEAQRDVEGKHPLLLELARKNTGLSNEIAAVATSLEKVHAGENAARQEARKISDDFQSTRKKLEIAGLNEALGEVLLKHRRLLPNQRDFRRKADAIDKDISETSLRQIQLEEEQRSIRNIVTYIAEYTKDLDPDEADAIRGDLQTLALNREILLDTAVATERDYLTALGELDFAQSQLGESVEAYGDFLSERLLWVRSSRVLGLDTLVYSIPDDLSQLLSPGNWLGVLGDLTSVSAVTPFVVLALVLAVIFILRGKRLYSRLRASGREVGRPLSDRFQYTLAAVGYSLMIAAVWPLLIAATGWHLSVLPEATDFSGAVSHGLQWLAATFFFLRVFRVVCSKGGVAEVHFRWSRHSLGILQREFGRLMLLYLPAGFVAITLVNYDPAAVAGAVGRVALIIAQLALAVFFYYLFQPGRGVLKWYLVRHKHSIQYRLRYLWFAIATGVPIILVFLSIAGYLYTSGTLTGSLARSLWLFITLILVHQLVVRWLLLIQRRLAYQTALERHEAERAAQEARAAAEAGREIDTEFFEEPDVDITSLSLESRKLLNLAVVIIGVTGMYFIWASILPAFGALREITLWHHTGVQAGQEQLLPVTLADVLLALLVIVIVVDATRRFPAFLEMVLLQRLRMTSGGRYTAKTLSRYVIVAAGVISVASMLGGSWSSIQWLVAALGVGIGFGLQEIVANFICGLIILFERPIRVGDRVIVGDVEGFVTRIQIRATTIQTFDRAELLVPNKEFITGRLLNMSLSDSINRLVIPVGVAYGSDVSKAMALMTEAATGHERIIDDPRPIVAFESFGDNSLLLVLRCFLDSLEFRLATISELHEMINDKLNAAGIVISFPQRDLHIDTLSPLDIRIHNDTMKPEGSA